MKVVCNNLDSGWPVAAPLHAVKASTVRSRPSRRATTTIELLTSFTLLTAVLGASLPLVVRHGRILSSARHYRLALDELSNQAERLTPLRRAEVEAAIVDLTPSTFAAEHLPGAELTAAVAPAESGDRITLSLSWDEPGRRAKPLSLVAWFQTDAGAGTADAEPPAEAATEDETP